jgi:hypothetical protein
MAPDAAAVNEFLISTMHAKARGRPRERDRGQRIAPVVDEKLLREFDAVAEERGLSRNKALEEAMRVFIKKPRQRRMPFASGS